MTFPDGLKQGVDVKAGSVVRMKGHMHIGENTGDADPDVILVELKENGTVEKTEKNLKQDAWKDPKEGSENDQGEENQ